MKPYTAHLVADLTRPIIGIDNRSGLEAFDIMADRIKGATFASPAPTEAVERALMEVVTAVRSYLPPDGIAADEMIARVIAAVDNPGVNPAIALIEGRSA